MSKQRGKPTLYEHLVRQSRSEGGLPPATPPSEPVPMPSTGGGPDLGGLLRGGRTVRLPVGYLLVGATLAMLFIVIAYSVGYSNGRERERLASQQQAESLNENSRIANELTNSGSGTDAASNRRPTPPDRTGGTSTPGNTGGAGNTGTNQPRIGDSSSGTNSGRPTDTGGSARPIETDPRQEGLNYFYLVTTSHENAVRVAQFCRQHGVEAYVVRANNLSRVVAVPGFRPEDDATRQRVEADIRRVKDLWRQQVGRDEIGMSPERYRG